MPSINYSLSYCWIWPSEIHKLPKFSPLRSQLYHLVLVLPFTPVCYQYISWYAGHKTILSQVHTYNNYACMHLCKYKYAYQSSPQMTCKVPVQISCGSCWTTASWAYAGAWSPLHPLQLCVCHDCGETPAQRKSIVVENSHGSVDNEYFFREFSHRMLPG